MRKTFTSGRWGPTSLTALGLAAALAGSTLIFRDTLAGRRYTGKIELHGKTVIVTGANSGIGLEIASNLAHKGARVILACRDIPAASEVKADIVRASRNRNIIVKKLDLASLESVRRFAQNVNETEPMVHFLVLNAGVMHTKERELSPDGLERQMASNYFGHFLLTTLLQDKMIKSAPARIIAMSCDGYKRGYLDFSNMNFETVYHPDKAYARSKLCLVLFARQLSKRLSGTGVTVNLADPGWICFTNLQRNESFQRFWPSRIFYSPFFWLCTWNALQGSYTPLYALLDPLLEKTTGQYFRNCEPVPFEPAARSNEDAERLWKLSEVWTAPRADDQSNVDTATVY